MSESRASMAGWALAAGLLSMAASEPMIGRGYGSPYPAKRESRPTCHPTKGFRGLNKKQKAALKRKRS